MWFPWNTGSIAAGNLQQTLLLTTPIILTALALAFAFRCGLFNIGGQGQYIAGTIFAVWLGTSFVNLNPWAHVILCLVAGTLAGAAWAGIAGILKATVGAHEVVSTIMLNWIAYWVGSYLFGEGGPLQGSQPSIPISNDIAEGAKLPVFWGIALLQGLSIGIFIAVAMLFVYWVIINRTTLGFEVRAVGFNPDAARYGGVSVARNYFLAMAISGSFAGLAGALDITGWEYHIGENDIQASTDRLHRSRRRAARAQHRARRRPRIASLRRADQRHLGPAARPVDLPSRSRRQPDDDHPGARHPLRRPEPRRRRRVAEEAEEAAGMTAIAARISDDAVDRPEDGRHRRHRDRCARLLARAPAARVAHATAADPARPPRDRRRDLGLVARRSAALAAGQSRPALLGIALGVLATRSSSAHLDTVVVWSALLAATLRYATPLTFAAIGGLFCERSGVINVALEGMLLTGAFFGIWGAIWAHGWAPGWEWVVGLVTAALAGMAMAAIHAVWAIHLKVDQIISGTAINFLALGITGYIFIDKYGDTARRATSPTTASPTSTSTSSATGTSSGRSSAS